MILEHRAVSWSKGQHIGKIMRPSEVRVRHAANYKRLGFPKLKMPFLLCNL